MRNNDGKEVIISNIILNISPMFPFKIFGIQSLFGYPVICLFLHSYFIGITSQTSHCGGVGAC